MSKLLRTLSAALLVSLGVFAADAQEAHLTLSTDTALWDNNVTAHLEGIGCSGGTSAPQPKRISGDNWVIDIDLLGCGPVSATTPFSYVVELGPKPPADYNVRIFNGDLRVANPSIAPLDTATVAVYDKATLDISVPDGASDAAPLSLVLSGPASSPCFTLLPPVVEGHAINAQYYDNCPVIPIPGPHVFEESFQVGPLAAGEYDVRFFEFGDVLRPRLTRRTLIVHDSRRCVPSATALCLQGGRFRVEVDWKDFQGQAGKGHPIPLATGDDSGLFWFFQSENIELTIKALNGCGLNHNWWIFISSGSTVEFHVKVTDTLTAKSKTYSNASGVAAPLIADTSAFQCVPNLDPP